MNLQPWRLIATLMAILTVTSLPSSEAMHEDPPENCTIMINDHYTIYHPLNGQPLATIPAQWICPP